MLSLACALKGEPGIYAIAGDTDGIDGTEDGGGGDRYAGHAHPNGTHAREMLAAHDSYSYFAASGDLVLTGRRSPTSTILGRLSCCKALPGPLFHRPGKHSPLKAYDKPVNLRTIFKLAPLS
ncbi:MOFRL family protein [Enterobacter mori]|uniref:MOFRL family protein n=1 Tax=Enterobacter mori TaxID=539813 RepID=UPI001FD05041|nr:MOFRL family protein [Enterobacter mori]